MNWLSVAMQDPSEIHNPDLLLFWHAPGRLLHPRACHYWGMHVKRGLLTPPMRQDQWQQSTRDGSDRLTLAGC